MLEQSLAIFLDKTFIDEVLDKTVKKSVNERAALRSTEELRKLHILIDGDLDRYRRECHYLSKSHDDKNHVSREKSFLLPAYNRLRKDSTDGTDEYYSLKTDHPNIFKYLENCFRRYAWTKACILTSPHLSEGSPWSDTRRSNPDRWGVRIEDELIREWFLPRV